jgi:hypothetical protein
LSASPIFSVSSQPFQRLATSDVEYHALIQVSIPYFEAAKVDSAALHLLINVRLALESVV